MKFKIDYFNTFDTDKEVTRYLNIPFLKKSIALKGGYKEGESIGEMFLEGDHNIEETFKRKAKKVFNMSSPWLIKYLSQYIY